MHAEVMKWFFYHGVAAGGGVLALRAELSTSVAPQRLRYS